MDSGSSNAALPPEKWADRVRLMSGNPETAREDGTVWTHPFPDYNRVTDLPKTEFEITAIGEAVEAVNGFRHLFCGLPPVAFSADRVHIITEHEFRRKVVRTRAHGKTWLGHVYLWRGWSPAMFFGLLTHELVHAVSYLWLDVRGAPRVDERGLTLPRILLRRSGMALIDPGFGTLLPHFHGLNEGATELAATVVRQILIAKTALLDGAGKNELKNFSPSPPLAAFIDRLVAIAAGSAGDTVPTMRELFVDMQTGTDRFLRELETNLPGATEVLRRTGARPFELRRSAEELGLLDLAEYIGQYCE